jgi:hypothetical protein
MTNDPGGDNPSDYDVSPDDGDATTGAGPQGTMLGLLGSQTTRQQG